MITKVLIEYIKEQRKLGIGREEVSRTLRKVGWKQEDIDQALQIVDSQTRKKEISFVSRSPESQITETETSLIKLPGPIALLKQSITITKQRFWVLVGISLSIFVVILVTTFLAGLVINSLFPDQTAQLENPLVLGEKAIMFFLFSLILGLLNFVIMLAGNIAVINTIYYRNEGIGLKKAYKRAFPKIIPLILTKALMWFVMMGATLIPGLTGTLVIIKLFEPNTLLIAISVLFLTIPAFILSIWLSMTSFTVLFEELKGISALVKSGKYVRGYVWAIIGRTAFIFVVLGLLLLFALLFQPLEGSETRRVYDIVMNIVAWIVSFAVVSYFILIYENLKETKKEVLIKENKKERILYISLAIAGALIIGGLFIFSIFSLAKIREFEPPNQFAPQQPEGLEEIQRQIRQLEQEAQ